MEKHYFRSFLFILILLNSSLFFLNKGKVFADGLTINAQEHYTFLPIIYKSFPAPSKLSGIVFDDRLDDRLSDAKVCIEGEYCVTTHTDGEYSFENLGRNEYQVTVTKIDYITQTKTISLPSGADIRQNYRLLPELDDGQMRITVTWDPTSTWLPDNIDNNLDIHLWTPTGLGTEYHHISFDNPGKCDDLSSIPYLCLESTADKGGGPEVVILSERVEGDYAFGVLNYNQGRPGVPSITELSVKVVVKYYKGGLMEYSVPQNGDGDFWYVFNIEDDTIVTEDLNCITSYGSGDEPPSCPATP